MTAMSADYGQAVKHPCPDCGRGVAKANSYGPQGWCLRCIKRYKDYRDFVPAELW